jgi:hypothetical protein
MELEQVQEYCQEAVKISVSEGTHAGLDFLIGEKFGTYFSKLRKVRQKLQYLYSSNEFENHHPLNRGDRSLKMSYTLTVQEHYGEPLEQVKHLESLLENFSEAISNSFSQEQIKSYLESSPSLPMSSETKNLADMEGNVDFSADDLILEAEEILVFEGIKKLLLKGKNS